MGPAEPPPAGPARGRPRLRVGVAALVAALVVALLGVAVVAVVERRDRRSLEARVARLESQGATTTQPPGRDHDGGDPFAGLLEALGGLAGGGGADGPAGGLGADLLGKCGGAFAGALRGGGGLTGLFGGLFGGDDDEEPVPVVAQVAAIVDAVEQLRGLRFTTRPAPVFVPPGELRARVRRLVDTDLPDQAAADETAALVALGALPAASDLKALVMEALADQVAGFYDTRTGELVVGEPGAADGGRLSAQARIVLAHELDHALADQALGLPLEDGRPPPGTEDAALARLTLVEGDATLLMQLYGLRHVPLREQLSGLAVALDAQEQLERLPPFLQRQLTFPYFEGLSFACRLHAQGGWDSVDAAYRNAPTTSAQVLFPERYAAGEAPLDPADPASPGQGWTPALSQAFGAAPLLWLLEAPGGEDDRALDRGRERAGDWGGGELRTWRRGDQVAVGLSLAARPGRAEALCATVAEWYRAAFPGDRAAGAQAAERLAADGPAQDAVVRCPAGGAVLVGIGPDLATARTVAGGG